METCVIVPSHISNINRTKMLMQCLHLLTNQTTKIPIYLSISFESEIDKILFNKLIEKNDLLNNETLYIIYQSQRTSQFRHIENVVDNIKDVYKYVMFCDDDDTYEIERVEKFMTLIEHGITNCPKDKIFAGCYERDLQQGSHSLSFYEYWSYCVNIEIILNFYKILKTSNYGYVIDNTMCDVLFATYLRCLDNRHMFVSVCEKLYNYNRNEFSITGTISKNNKRNREECLQTYTNNFELFIKNTNEDIERQMEEIKNHIFVKYSMRKTSLDDILKLCLKENYIYKDKIDKNILSKIKHEYDTVKGVCDVLYQYK
uniref:Glycosyltransferase 2-like domain-containing protein n=1 Tax=viral metagenome TaxID=1070528 RepID=A0A6C0L9B3_9ZZZZ